jgi:hypothetical protein
VESVLLIVGLLGENPLHCGFCRREVDAERLGLEEKDVDQIVHWYSAANAMYKLWLHAGEYEAYAKSCLVDPKGQLNVDGLSLAQSLSRYVPTKMWFFRDVDDGVPKKCPVCGSELVLDVKWGSGRCEGCFLQI